MSGLKPPEELELYPPVLDNATARVWGAVTVVMVGTILIGFYGFYTPGLGLYQPRGWEIYPLGVENEHTGAVGTQPTGRVESTHRGLYITWVVICPQRGKETVSNGRRVLFPTRCGNCTLRDAGTVTNGAVTIPKERAEL